MVFLANTATQIESLLHSRKQAVGHIALYVKAYKTEYRCFNREGAISTLNGGPEITYLDSNVFSMKVMSVFAHD